MSRLFTACRGGREVLPEKRMFAVRFELLRQTFRSRSALHLLSLTNRTTDLVYSGAPRGTPVGQRGQIVQKHIDAELEQQHEAN